MMNILNVESGKNVPNEINVVIEIPAYSDPVKYEVDKKTGALFVDRFLTTAMHYPCNYGYVPQTLSEDGDPVDILVITPYPLLSYSVVVSRPIGILEMTDEAGKDVKVLAVPADKLSREYREVREPKDLPQAMLDKISHFFQHYKDLEQGKWVKVDGWQGPELAKKEIMNSIERFKNGSKTKACC